jgi:hypothetical protein
MANGYKTYVVAALTVGYAVCGLFSGNLEASTAITLISGALMGAFIRHGVTTEVNK